MTHKETRALLVEDDATSRRVMQAALENRGLNVSAFANAEEAWSACQETHFDLGLIDWKLPGMDGLDLCRHIRSSSWGDRTVLIIVSALERSKYLSDILKAGADDFISKPFDQTTLDVRIEIAEKLLSNRLRRKAAEISLIEARDEMEAMVAQRTVSLQQTLKELRAEIDERRHVEKERTRLVTAIEQTDDTIIVTDAEGKILHVNPAFERNTGFSAEDALGSTPRILKSDQHDDDFYTELWLTLKAGRVWKGHFVNRRANGKLCEVDASITPIRDETGAVINFVGVNRDVTEKLALERQLRQAQRMEAIGQFAGQIAHDFGNLISVAQATVDLIAGRLSPDDANLEDLKTIRRTTVSCGELTRALLAFAREQVVETEDLNLDTVLDHLEPVLRRLISSGTTLKIEHAEGLDTINAGRSQIEQVILNLCTNARDAMPRGGNLTIRTNNVPAPETDSGSHRSVELTVTDTGRGMDNSTLEQIFVPFFTTKETGEGNGLGLATVYGIVKQHRGQISVASEPGQGTTFSVHFPAVGSLKRVEIPTHVHRLEVQKGGHETLLVVEDHPDLRHALTTFLASLGYRVLDAEDGEQAFDILTIEKNSIDMVITDLKMPKMSGLELFEASQTNHAGLRFLFCSGFFPDFRNEEALEHRATAFLEKPFELEDIRRQVRELLDRNLEGLI